MRDVDEPGLVGVEFRRQVERPLPGHVLRAEGARDAVGVVVSAAQRVVVTEARRDDGVGEQQVRVREGVPRLGGEVVAGVAGQRQLCAGLGVRDRDAVRDERRVVDRDELDLEAAGLEPLEGGPGADVDPVAQVVVLPADRLGDALAGFRVGLGRGVHRQVARQPVDVAQAVEVVEVDVGDQPRVREPDARVEKLAPEVRAEVDQERLAGPVVRDVDGEPRPRDPPVAGRPAGVTVAADRRRPRRVARSQERDPHRLRLGRAPT